MYREYFSDEDHLREWLKAEEDPETFKAFLDRNHLHCDYHFQYMRETVVT
jgi:hypothetical protein